MQEFLHKNYDKTCVETDMHSLHFLLFLFFIQESLQDILLYFHKNIRNEVFIVFWTSVYLVKVVSESPDLHQIY